MAPEARHVWAVVEPRATGFGPSVWVGELRTADDKPVMEHLHGKADGRIIAPVSVGATKAEVLELLRKRAKDLRYELVDTTTVRE